jgi:transcriptional regulator with GAF, ATPase, and Fis domain
MNAAFKKEEDSREISKLRSLYEIAKVLGSSLDLKEIYPKVLVLLSALMGMKRGGISLLNPESNEWEMAASHGLSSEEIKRRKEYFGSGIAPRIMERGQMAAVIEGGENSWFYEGKGKKAPNRSSVPFFCSPIKVQGMIVGILGVDHLYEEPIPVTEDLNLLGEICDLIGEAIGMRKTVSAENRALLEENWSFRKELENLGRSLPKARKRIPLTEILEERISRMIADMKVDPRSNGCLYDEVLNIVERTLLKSSLEKTKHIQLKTARFLGINRNTLRRKIKELGITAPGK